MKYDSSISLTLFTVHCLSVCMIARYPLHIFSHSDHYLCPNKVLLAGSQCRLAVRKFMLCLSGASSEACTVILAHRPS